MPQKITSVSIEVDRANRKLVLLMKSSEDEKQVISADVVSGCEETGTPAGNYKAAKWIKDKVNPIHGPTPWSKGKWANPYGPYFLPLLSVKDGHYTQYGIHGTRGPLFGGFEKPPVPKGLLNLFLEENAAKYLYCSHGCVRLSNKNITTLFEETTRSEVAGLPIMVIIK